MRSFSLDFLSHTGAVFGVFFACGVSAADNAPNSAGVMNPPVSKASAFPPLQITDIPRSTQAGPAPESGRGIPAPFPADAKLPTLWLIGDSTVRNGTAGDGGNGQWGWGAPLVAFFDPTLINVVNRAAGGTSARSFYTGNWKRMAELLKRGDVVLMQFGTNDGGQPASSVGELRGIGDETQSITNRSGQPETIHTYGWYLRQIITEARAKGVTPIVCSLIPRKSWDASGHIQRATTTFAGWARQVAEAEKVGFVDLNETIARRYDILGKEAVDLLYYPRPTTTNPRGEYVHTGWEGAIVNAESVVSGLKALPDNPVAAFLSERGKEIEPAMEKPVGARQ
jgi:lysophospholipase L1-like esterase